MLLNKQSSDWWLKTSWLSCGVTVIITQFRYYKWLRLQWESTDVSCATSKGILWLCRCKNNAIKHNCNDTNDYVSNYRVSMSLLVPARTCFWATCQEVGYLGRHGTRSCSVTVKTLLQNKTRFLQRQTHTGIDMDNLISTKITFPVRKFGCFFCC